MGMQTALIPNFEAAFMAMDRVLKLLEKVTRELDKAGVPYAVVGGNAVAAWVATVDPEAVRSTKDVDILASREHLATMEESLDRIGFDMIDVMGVTMFVDRTNPNPKSGVHVVIANEKIRPHYRYPAPDVGDAVRSTSGYSVINLPALVAMKLQSFRLVDQTHMVDLKSVGLITPDLVDLLPADLQERLRHIPEPDTH